MIKLYGIDIDDGIPRGWGCACCGAPFTTPVFPYLYPDDAHELSIKRPGGKQIRVDVCVSCCIKVAAAQRKASESDKAKGLK